MTHFAWIRRLFDARIAADTRLSRRRRALQLETLEDRLVPSTFTVTDVSDNPNDKGSIRYAVNNLSAGSNHIDFSSDVDAGAILLSNGELSINQDVTITGPGADKLTISGMYKSRVLEVQAGATVQVSGLTLGFGSAVDKNGGAVFNSGTLTLLQCTITGSTTTAQPPAYDKGQQRYHPSFTPGGWGGGVYNAPNATITIEQSTIANNTAQGGSGVGGDSGRGAAGEGGGVFNSLNATMTIINSTVSGNSAIGGDGANGYSRGIDRHRRGGGFGSGGRGSFGSGGGGYYLAPAGGFGGAYPGLDLPGSSVTLGGTFVVYGGTGGNGGSTGQRERAGSGYRAGGAGMGGGVFSKGTLTITSSTIAENTAKGGSGGANGARTGAGVGGGVFADNVLNSSATIDSSIVCSNVVGGPTRAFDNDVTGAFTDLGYNLVGNTSGATGLDASTDVQNGAILLSPLANNGGTTLTMAITANSQAAGAGDPANGNAVDQRGRLRGATPDIGAFQVTKEIPILTWNTPQAITYGTPLSDTQLNAAANVPGTFTYTPAAGSILLAARDLLTVVFTPNDTEDYLPAEANVALHVNRATPTIQVSDAGGTFTGTAFPATASVTGIGGLPDNSLEGITPTLTYYAGNQASGTPLAGAPTAAGVYTVTAAFPGSTDFAAVSAATTFSINQTPTMTVLSMSGTTFNVGQSITFTAMVSDTLGIPRGGMVQFQVDGQNFGAPAALDASGSASYTTTALSAGSHTITAQYTGYGNFAASVSQALNVNVLGIGDMATGSELLVGGNTNDQVHVTPVGGITTGITGVQTEALDWFWANYAANLMSHNDGDALN